MTTTEELLLAEARRTNQLLEQLIQALSGRAGAGAPMAASFAGGAPAGGAAQIADDGDLDSQYGNPVVRKDPTRWTGPSYVGSTYSDCPADYLETLAGLLDWQAGKSDEKNELLNNGKPRSQYLRKDAARARGWAQRNKSKGGGGGYNGRPAAAARPAPRPVEEPPPLDDDVPFLSTTSPIPSRGRRREGSRKGGRRCKTRPGRRGPALAVFGRSTPPPRPPPPAPQGEGVLSRRCGGASGATCTA